MRCNPASQTSADLRSVCGSVLRYAAGILFLSLFAPALISFTAHAEADTKVRIAFAGDSLVDNYWSGLSRLVAADACLRTNLDLRHFSRASSGLSRSDFVNWPREIAKVNASYNPHLTVISIGVNDRQMIIDGNGGRTQFGAPGWSDKYRQQIDAFLAEAIASKAIVLIVGLPVMRDSAFNTDAQTRTGMYAEVVGKIGAPNLHFVRPWRLNPEGTDAYASYGPDKTGRLVQLRDADGMHFAAAGEDVLAAYLLPKILAALSEAGIMDGQCQNAQQINIVR
jgi:uncharacterized protein